MATADAPLANPATEPAEAEAKQQWEMPDLVGANLQDAQNEIQALTDGAVFYSGSHDLTGEDRNQMLDANWKVCTQNITAGSPVTIDSEIDFGVVKVDELCP